MLGFLQYKGIIKLGGDQKLTDEQENIVKKRKDVLQLFLTPPYFKLPVLSIPIIRGGVVAATLHLKLEMKASDRDSFERAKVLIDRLIDAIFTDLYGAFSNLWIQQYDPSPDVLKERVAECTKRVMGEGKVEDIYLKEIYFNRSQKTKPLP